LELYLFCQFTDSGTVDTTCEDCFAVPLGPVSDRFAPHRQTSAYFPHRSFNELYEVFEL